MVVIFKTVIMMTMIVVVVVMMVVIFKTGAGRIVISYRLALATQNSMNTMRMRRRMRRRIKMKIRLRIWFKLSKILINFDGNHDVR